MFSVSLLGCMPVYTNCCAQPDTMESVRFCPDLVDALSDVLSRIKLTVETWREKIPQDFMDKGLAIFNGVHVDKALEGGGGGGEGCVNSYLCVLRWFPL